MSCVGCSAAVKGGYGNHRCKNGFIQGSYPSGISNCMKEDGPGKAYWLFPPDQWEALGGPNPVSPHEVANEQ